MRLLTPAGLALGCAALLCGQIGEYQEDRGPSILSRGGGADVPRTAVTFRPFVNVSGIYTSGLFAGPGGEFTGGAVGIEGAAGLYGYHGWKKTLLGVNYRSDYRHYNKSSSYNHTSHFLNFGVTHQLSPRLDISFRQGAGSFSQNYGYFGSFGFFDPTFAGIPHDEMLDRRVWYFTSMADATYYHTSRLSFNFGATGFAVRRELSSLYGVNGASARADAAYRLTRHSTVGVDYFFTHFSFNKVFGASDLHSVGLNYSARLSREWSLGLRAGLTRIEALTLTTVQLDPLVAAILGRQQGVSASYGVNLAGTYGAQVSRSFRHAVASASFSRGASPGNGIYLTSNQTTFSGNYSYNGLRRWSLTGQVYYSSMRSIGQDIGRYRAVSVGAGVTRSLGSNLFATLRGDLRRYSLSSGVTRDTYSVALGFAFSPGDIPLTLW